MKLTVHVYLNRLFRILEPLVISPHSIVLMIDRVTTTQIAVTTGGIWSRVNLANTGEPLRLWFVTIETAITRYIVIKAAGVELFITATLEVVVDNYEARYSLICVNDLIGRLNHLPPVAGGALPVLQPTKYFVDIDGASMQVVYDARHNTKAAT